MSFFMKFKTSSALTPYYSSEHQNMLYESLKVSPERPAAGNTCVSMENLRILGSKTSQNDRFSLIF